MEQARLYVFDIGGVVSFRNDAQPSIAEQLGITGEEFRRHTGDLLDLMSTGRLDSTGFWAEFTRRTGIAVEEDLWATSFHPVTDAGVVGLIGGLRRRARVVAGTNTIEPHYRDHLRRGDYDAFDAVYASCRMGLAKPDPEFYRHILAMEGRSPGETVFVDDLEENVTAAGRLGIRAIRFRGLEDLRGRLRPGGV